MAEARGRPACVTLSDASIEAIVSDLQWSNHLAFIVTVVHVVALNLSLSLSLSLCIFERKSLNTNSI